VRPFSLGYLDVGRVNYGERDMHFNYGGKGRHLGVAWLCVRVLSQDVVGFDADAYYHSSPAPVVFHSSHFLQR
jgi:hypothetical protein